MPRKGILKEEVILGIEALIEKGETPTALKVRNYLERGSLTTIQKHFRWWKLSSYKSTCKIAAGSLPDPKIAVQKDVEEAKATHEKRVTQNEQNRVLSAELIKSEKENIQFKEEIKIVQKELREITEKHKTLQLKHEHLEKLCQEITAERTAIAAEIMKDKNQQIEALQQELRQINKDSLEQIKKMGFEGDDALIREKVKTINLEDKVNVLTEQMKSLEKTLKIEKEASQSLRQQLKDKKAFMQKMVTQEQLQQSVSFLSER